MNVKLKMYKSSCYSYKSAIHAKSLWTSYAWSFPNGNIKSVSYYPASTPYHKMVKRRYREGKLFGGEGDRYRTVTGLISSVVVCTD